MARLLVYANNRNGRRGEIIAVMPDGHEWSHIEVPPNFEQIDFPREPVEAFIGLLEPDLDAENDDAFIARRKVRIGDVDAAKASRTGLEMREHLVAYRPEDR